MGKETIIHNDHQPLQYIQSQTKLHQSMHFMLMGSLQNILLVIKYRKGIHNKVVDMSSRPPTDASIFIQQISFVHSSYVE